MQRGPVRLNRHTDKSYRTPRLRARLMPGLNAPPIAVLLYTHGNHKIQCKKPTQKVGKLTKTNYLCTAVTEKANPIENTFLGNRADNFLKRNGKRSYSSVG